MKMNLPNKLTILRMILLPFVMVSIIFPIFPGDIIWRLVAAALFGITSLTDMLDGKIARKYNLVTDFGKFLDPLADKMLVIGTMIAIMIRFGSNSLFLCVFGWALFIVTMRELAITSLRMIAASKAGKVIAAAWLGKIKTVTQIVCLLTVLLEGVICAIFQIDTHMILSYLTTVVMLVMTLWSGLDYFFKYLPLLKEEE